MDNLHKKLTGIKQDDCSGIPMLKSDRDLLAKAVDEYVAELYLVPPLSAEEITVYAKEFIKRSAMSSTYLNLVAVLIGNSLWRETVASIPYERRVLFLPQCLRRRDKCLATHDNWGLICANCGECLISELQTTAEELGYTVLVAEGTTLVTQMLIAGKVDAVIGVSCLPVLEKAFPRFQYNAIPGMAIPLYKDGCEDTKVDLDWIKEILELRSTQLDPWRLDFDRLKNKVDSWFQTQCLTELLKIDGTQTEKIAVAWLSQSGKRWRPFLTAAVFEALTYKNDLHPSIPLLAVAVECFHKASLIHDDIEDNDDIRNGAPALHRQYNPAIALNIGDLLLGEGYRLIAESGATPEQIQRLLAVAAVGHRRLSVGQGEELLQVLEQAPYTPERVIEIFKLKTAPAFEVAASFGAIQANADAITLQILIDFSTYLGIAYQIKDDLEDFFNPGTAVVSKDMAIDLTKPSLVISLLYESADEAIKNRLSAFWQERTAQPEFEAEILAQINDLKIREKTEGLYSHYKKQVLESLAPLKNSRLKSLLYRVAGRILQ